MTEHGYTEVEGAPYGGALGPFLFARKRRRNKKSKGRNCEGRRQEKKKSEVHMDLVMMMRWLRCSVRRGGGASFTFYVQER